MSESRTIPFFKIIAALCLGIVCVVEIKIMVDFADNYKYLTQAIDAEYLTILYYIMGFSFLAIAFTAVLTSGKNKFSILAASVEFLLVLCACYYVKEHFEPNENMDEITYFLVLIPGFYADQHILVLLLSTTALIFSILDITIGNVFSAISQSNSCIYCGRRLRHGEKCTCDLDDTYVINDFETDPVNYADDVEKRKCVYCSRLLYGTEVCNCPGSMRKEAEEERKRKRHDSFDAPSFSSSTPKYDVAPKESHKYTPPSETSGRKGMFINKEFKTNPGTKDGSPDSSSGGLHTTPSKKPSDNKFFSKPSDL